MFGKRGEKKLKIFRACSLYEIERAKSAEMPPAGVLRGGRLITMNAIYKKVRLNHEAGRMPKKRHSACGVPYG